MLRAGKKKTEELPRKISRSDAKGRPKTFRAMLTIDFTYSKDPATRKRQTAEATKITVALVELGWTHLETTSFIIESPTLKAIWTGAEVVMKQTMATGFLSAFTFQILGSASWSGFAESSTLSGPNTLAAILNLKLPRQYP